jgi:aryl-alcohol dehydrogenase-like predicted oxidoreductase
MQKRKLGNSGLHRRGDPRYQGENFDANMRAAEAVREVAQTLGVKPGQVAIAWLLQKQPITAPIVGATKISHLEDAIGALSVKLTQEEAAYLEEPYVPHRIVGHQ